MKKRFPIIVTVSILTVCAMLGILYCCRAIINRQTTENCFTTLSTSAHHLAINMRKSMLMDKAILKVDAASIAAAGDIGDGNIGDALLSISSSFSYINHVELLTPDNCIVRQNGSVTDASGFLDFRSEAAKREYISEITHDISNPDEKIIRSAVPVIQDGEIVAMLYGVISLKELSEEYVADAYDGNAYVYLENGDNGDFIVDTWHKELGNLIDLGERETMPGYNFEKFADDLVKGKTGRAGFISKTTGSEMYIAYEPTGINNWNVMLSVTEEVAFADTREISSTLLFMAGAEILVLLLYMGIIVALLLQSNRTIKRMGTEDATTALQNRNTFELLSESSRDKPLTPVVCAYIDANRLHEINNLYGHAAGDKMLKTVADCLKAAFPYKSVYRIGGDEFIVLSEELTVSEVTEKIKVITQQIEKDGYSISVGVAASVEGMSLEAVVNAADSKMLESKRIYYENNDRRGR